jgi:ABC-type antimicrobial peptide transport system permease subunit
MALGAGKAHIFGQVLRQGLQLTVAGLAAGLIAALFLTRFVRNLLYGVGTMDWLTFAAVSALLGAVALVACLLPARRAAQVEPMQALRTE